MIAPHFATCAMWWARRGFAVFPVVPRGKRPLGKLVPHGVKDSCREQETIAEWWRRAPKANIGLAVPNGVLVVDLDGDQACRNWVNLCGRNGEPDQTLSVTTGRGRHVYFKTSVQIGNSTGRIGPSIDTRGPGGYTIAPPSIHPGGAIYSLDGHCIEISEAPRWLTDLALAGIKPGEMEIPPAPPLRATHGFGTLHAVEGIVRAVAGAKPGERNSLTYWGACRMREKIAEGAISCVLGQALLFEAARRTGLPKIEAHKTIASGIWGAHG